VSTVPSWLPSLNIRTEKGFSGQNLCDPVHNRGTKRPLYWADELSQLDDRRQWKSEMDQEFRDEPLSESTVTLRLAEIQKRCSDLLSEPDGLEGLALEGEEIAPGDRQGFNPYNHG
jgi:hypothetical protein